MGMLSPLFCSNELDNPKVMEVLDAFTKQKYEMDEYVFREGEYP
jgi:hypothetical protein